MSYTTHTKKLQYGNFFFSEKRELNKVVSLDFCISYTTHTKNYSMVIFFLQKNMRSFYYTHKKTYSMVFFFFAEKRDVALQKLLTFLAKKIQQKNAEVISSTAHLKI